MDRVGPLFKYVEDDGPIYTGRLESIEAKLDRILALLDKPAATKPALPKRERKAQADVRYTPEFEEIWQSYPRRAGSNPKLAAYTAFRARITAGESISAIRAGVVAYRAYCEATGALNGPYVMQASRFFGPGKEYLTDWTPPDAEPKTEADWLALGEKRGLSPRAGESWNAFQERVKQA